MRTPYHVHRDYERNMRDLLRTVGQPLKERRKFLKRERELNLENIKLQKKYGVFIQDPCPLRYHKDCYRCSGRYNKKEMVSEGGTKCAIKKEVSFVMGELRNDY